MAMERYYITTPIYYVNSTPHIGHAYTTIAADMGVSTERVMQLVEWGLQFIADTACPGRTVGRPRRNSTRKRQVNRKLGLRAFRE